MKNKNKYNTKIIKICIFEVLKKVLYIELKYG